MVLKILLLLSIIIQLSAAIVAIGLTRKTKYNLSWILFTVGLTVMAFMRFAEYIQMSRDIDYHVSPVFFVWMGIATSLCFAGGVLLVQKIFKYIAGVDSQRRITERRILNTVLRTEEKERQRFSKDLHDGLGPLLSSAKMSVSALSTSELSEHNREIIRNANLVLDEAVRSLREVSANLSPLILNDFGLSRAISNFINKLPREEMSISFHTNLGSVRFDPDIEVILYRVICELINNSLKHSGATSSSCVLTYSPGSVHVEYMDNGLGFQVEEEMGQGMGLSNMFSRISSLKGEISIESRPKEGMKAIIDIQI